VKAYLRNYNREWRYGEQDRKLCEVHLAEGREVDAADVHHITPRRMGGGKPELDEFWNLIGLCRECHDRAEGRSKKHTKLTRDELYELKIWPRGKDQTYG
jgi:5-methylcytosine-specific restriction endonuclease McrA